MSSVLQILLRTRTSSRRTSVCKSGNLFSSGHVTAIVNCSAVSCLTCSPFQRTRSPAKVVLVRTATSGTPTRRSATSFSTVWKACRTFCPVHPDSYTTTAVVRAPGRRRAGGRTVSTAREVGAVRTTTRCTTHFAFWPQSLFKFRINFQKKSEKNATQMETIEEENSVEHSHAW